MKGSFKSYTFPNFILIMNFAFLWLRIWIVVTVILMWLTKCSTQNHRDNSLLFHKIYFVDWQISFSIFIALFFKSVMIRMSNHGWPVIISIIELLRHESQACEYSISYYQSGPWPKILNFQVCRFPFPNFPHLSYVMLQLISFDLMKYSFWPALTRWTYGLWN